MRVPTPSHLTGNPGRLSRFFQAPRTGELPVTSHPGHLGGGHAREGGPAAVLGLGRAPQPPDAAGAAAAPGRAPLLPSAAGTRRRRAAAAGPG